MKFDPVLTLYQTTNFWTTKFKAFADNKSSVARIMIYQQDKVVKIAGKGENAGYQHFLLFSQCLQKASFLGSLKLGLCGKELNIIVASFWRKLLRNSSGVTVQYSASCLSMTNSMTAFVFSDYKFQTSEKLIIIFLWTLRQHFFLPT